MLDLFAEEVPFVEVAGFRVLEPSFLLAITAWQRPMLLGADRTEAAGWESIRSGIRDGDLRAMPESRDRPITHCGTETALFSDRIGVAEATNAAAGVEDRARNLTRLLQPNEGGLPAGDVHGAVSWYADSKCSLLIALITFGPNHRPSDARPDCVKDTGSLGPRRTSSVSLDRMGIPRK